MKNVSLKLRIYCLLIAFIFMFVIIDLRLFSLQIVNKDAYQLQSDKNRMRFISIEAARGEVLDKNGIKLAVSKADFVISLNVLDDKNIQKKTIQNLVDILKNPEITVNTIELLIKDNVRMYEPVKIVSLSADKADSIKIISEIAEKSSEMPGLNIETVPTRYYPQGTLAGHTLGYLGKISSTELENFGAENYNNDDLIGKIGFERAAEKITIDGVDYSIKGKKGVKQVEVNSFGQLVSEKPFVVDPIPGYTFKLTIDSNLQLVMEKSLTEMINMLKVTYPKANAGAAVAINVKTGEILAISSKPDINPNDFVDGNYGKKLDYYNDELLKPIYNRAIQAEYPPGSTFKMVTAMAALYSGKASVNDPSINCTGAYWKKPFIRDWTIHGTTNFYQFLARSCNVYAQYLGEKAGIANMNFVGNEFGLGKRTNTLGIYGEKRGILPSPEWKLSFYDGMHKQILNYIKEKKYQSELEAVKTEAEKNSVLQKINKDIEKENARYKNNLFIDGKWQAYDTYNTSIGQGLNQYTVLQLANYVATIANDGTLREPTLIKEIIAPDGSIVKKVEAVVVKQVAVDKNIIAEVKKGMLAVTQAGGTAYTYFKDFPIKVAAKSGTAETGMSGDKANNMYHGVFVSFAPYDDPEIAVACLVEYGRSGGSSAGQICKAVLQQYFFPDTVNSFDPKQFLSKIKGREE
ncbi:MAG: penicillin-binding protein 2 [Clostridia bacterium]